MADQSFFSGREHVIDAYGCSPSALRSKTTIQRLVARVLDEMQLRVVGEPVWHVFPEPGGLTGFVLLAESHLSVHTFPEHRYAALNLYCCRQTPVWDWEAGLSDLLGAEKVIVRTVVRGGTPPADFRTLGMARFGVLTYSAGSAIVRRKT